MNKRKIKRSNEIYKQLNYILEQKKIYRVCPPKLKDKIPEETLFKFRINEGNEKTIKKAIEYLNGKNTSEIKFGAFLLSKFFEEKIEDNENEKFKLDIFLKHNLIKEIIKVLTEENEMEILSELIAALVNITYFEAENGGNKYKNEFIDFNFLGKIKEIIKMGNLDLVDGIIKIIYNLTFDSLEFNEFFFKEEELLKLIIPFYEHMDEETKKTIIFILIKKNENENKKKEEKENEEIKYKFISAKARQSYIKRLRTRKRRMKNK